MPVKQFIERSRNATSVEELLRLLRKALCNLGIEQTIVTLLTITVLSGLPCYSLLQNDPDDSLEDSSQLEDRLLTPSRRLVATSNSRTRGNREEHSEETPGKGDQYDRRVSLRSPHEERSDTLATDALQTGADLILDANVLHHIHRLVRQFYQVYWSLEEKNRNAACSALSAREREVLQWCARGRSRDEISATLGISRNTVDFHLHNIYRKLDAGNMIVAVVKALQYGLIRA